MPPPHSTLAHCLLAAWGNVQGHTGGRQARLSALKHGGDVEGLRDTGGRQSGWMEVTYNIT